MNANEMLSDFAAYNVWANRLISKMVNELGEEGATEIIISSFPSIYKTMLHIIDAQVLWMHRMQHDHFPEAPSKNFKGSLEDLNDTLRTSSENLRNFIVEMKDEDYSKTLTYKNSKGVQYTSHYSETILHCLNHSTFHRGQIITMLRQLGNDKLIGTDYVAYCRGSNPFI